ncbi:MAG TPA: ATP synthase subunit I [Methylophilaceae bacterium]|jgi:ATP synthase protein I
MQNVKTADVFKQMAKWQILVTLAVALISGYFSGIPGALSALAGGGSVIVGAFVGSLIAKSNENKKNPSAILVGLLKAEGAKIIVIATLLLIVFKVYAAHLVPLALIVGLGASAIMSGAAILSLNEKIKI